MASWSHDPETQPISKPRPTVAEHMKPPSLDIEKLAGHEALKAAFPDLNFRLPAGDEDKLRQLSAKRDINSHL